MGKQNGEVGLVKGTAGQQNGGEAFCDLVESAGIKGVRPGASCGLDHLATNLGCSGGDRSSAAVGKTGDQI